MTLSKFSTIDGLSATAITFGANPVQTLKSTTVDFDEVNFGVATENNLFLDNEIEEIEKLKKEISKLHKDTRNLNKQIQQAKNNGNNNEQNRLIQEKKCIQNQIKLKENKLDKLLKPDENCNKDTRFKNDSDDKKVTEFDVNLSGDGAVTGLKDIRKVNRRVSEPTSILGSVPVSGFVDSSLKRHRISQLVSKLTIGMLCATGVAFAANPAHAVNLGTGEYITVDKTETINFDENVGVGDNPLNGGTKLDNLWSNYGLKLDSRLKNDTGVGTSELWLYDSNCEGSNCTGGDPDLATGKGQNGNLKYKSANQRKVLIIQEHKGEADDYANRRNPGTISFDFTDDVGVLFNSIKLLDFDDPGQPIFSAFFADGTSTGDFTYDGDSFTEKEGSNQNKVTDNRFVRNSKADSKYIRKMKILSTNWEGTEYVEGDNSLRKYDFDFGGKTVTKFNVTLPGSGAVTELKYIRKVRRKVPEPTSILGLVGVSAVVASSLKRKRKSSNA